MKDSIFTNGFSSLNLVHFPSSKIEDILKTWSEYYYLPVYKNEESYELYGHKLDFVQSYTGYFCLSNLDEDSLTVFYHETQTDYRFYCYKGRIPLDILGYADKFDEIRSTVLV